ncbi:MAG: BamA/TamA family outer membrane protein [Nitrospirota bacterium]
MPITVAMAGDPATDPVSRQIEDVTRPVSGIMPESLKTELVVMPMPLSNPTIGTGLAFATMILYRLDEQSPPSSTTVGGAYTNSGTWGAGVSQKTFFDQDRYRFNLIAGYADANIDFYGIGTSAGDRGTGIPISQSGTVALPELSVRAVSDAYIGLRYRYLAVTTSSSQWDQLVDDLGDLLPGTAGSIPQDIRTVSAGPGVAISYDSRDNPLNAYRGTSLNLLTDFMREGFGSDHDYTLFKLTATNYRGLGDRGVLALQGFACATNGDTVLRVVYAGHQPESSRVRGRPVSRPPVIEWSGRIPPPASPSPWRHDFRRIGRGSADMERLFHRRYAPKLGARTALDGRGETPRQRVRRLCARLRFRGLVLLHRRMVLTPVALPRG